MEPKAKTGSHGGHAYNWAKKYAVVMSDLKVTRAVDPSWLDATALTAESVEVRCVNDPDGKVGGDDKRSMRSLPSGLSGLLGGVIMAALGERDLLGERDRLEMRLFVSQPGGDPQP